MREWQLDFQPRRPGLLSLTLLLAGLVLLGDAGLEARWLSDQQAALADSLFQARKRVDRQTLAQREAPPEQVFSADEVKALRAAVAAIGVDWEGLFHTIDGAVGKDVVLLAVRPNAVGKSVLISGEARDMKAVLAFVDTLRGSRLPQVALQSHQIRQNDPQHPIVFEVAATWLSGL